MADQGKIVKNQLFNASVTGATFEDFSQNALIFPAQEPPRPAENPTVDYLSDNPSRSDFVEKVNVQQDSGQAGFGNSGKLEQEQSHFTSVFSSFSNILKLKQPQATSGPEGNVDLPAGIGNIIGQDENGTAAPVPLFNSNATVLTSPPSSTTSPPQGPANNYRRAGLKKPTYAKLPGLSSPPPQTQFQPLSPITQPHFPQNPSQNAFPPNPERYFLPELSTYTENPSNDQHPFSPPPPAVTYFGGNHQDTLSTTSSTAVMAAIPASEITQHSTGNIPMGNPEHYSYEQNNENILSGPESSVVNQPSQIYRPVYHHWFHKLEVEGRVLWQPFSMVDSLALEQAFTSTDLSPEKVVPTDGGRFDVNILRRQRVAVYWKSTPTEVRRCSWFHKRNSDGRYVPYEENIATMLEEQYKIAFESNSWHRRVELPNGETVVFHGHDVLVLFPQSQSPDAWGNTPQNQTRPRVVKRGMDEFDIDEGEPAKVDHLLFLVHGIGSVCDLKFRSVEEVVDEFRSISLQLVRSHYRSSCETGLANRIEVLPISWHEKLHSEDTGIDKKLRSITLESIPKLRNFTNDTLLDILFYTSPFYCQTIISHVGGELNRIYDLFRQRNPTFEGGVSLGGHSLGSLILFDLLCHQHPEPEKEDDGEEEKHAAVEDGVADEDVVLPLKSSKPHPLRRRMSRRISYMMGRVGTGQPELHYPHLSFQPAAFFALGSPIGMFVTVRGLDNLGEQFALPTCPSFFNIFHPYDPVAYRIESLVNPQLSTLKPVLIPHHKGRKRMHLELKETMVRVGADLKQRIIESVKSTWNSVYQLTMFKGAPNQPSFEEEVNKAIAEQLAQEATIENVDEAEEQQTDLSLGMLNGGRRIDHVLQEAPFEFFNEYIFALTSHVCYWESEDTMLLILKEIYSTIGVSSDSQIPQQTMTIERSSSSSQKPYRSQLYPSCSQENTIGIDPTMPQNPNNNLGPPPMSGFVRKT